jgi:hypothetical protein
LAKNVKIFAAAAHRRLQPAGHWAVEEGVRSAIAAVELVQRAVLNKGSSASVSTADDRTGKPLVFDGTRIWPSRRLSLW